MPSHHAGHLVRVALVFLIGCLAFFAVRSAVVTKTFGQYGHYRAAAIGDVAARPALFAGHQTCETCHTDEAALKATGKHANVACEACHGALAKHAEDPGSLVPTRPDTAVLCVRCHEANSAKPKAFPQVDSKEHSGGAPCGTCHQPHKPGIG